MVVRTPPSRAVYHRTVNPLFEMALHTVCAQKDVICVVLTRHAEQVAAIEALALPNCILPRVAIDSRSLIFASDLMIGAGGTMTREAALIGIPTFTVFAGKTPAVDIWLERRGLLARLTEPAQIEDLAPRRSEPRAPSEMRARADVIAQVISETTLAAASGRGRHSRASTAV